MAPFRVLGAREKRPGSAQQKSARREGELQLEVGKSGRMVISTRRCRCGICRHGFDADPRVRGRQKVCSRKECQSARRQQTQAGWRRRHPGYFIQWRAKKRAEDNAAGGVDPPRVPPPISDLPWEMAQEEFGVMGADFLASLGRKVLVHAKDQTRIKTAEIADEFSKVAVASAKDPRLAHLTESTEQSPEVGVGVPKDQRLVVPG